MPISISDLPENEEQRLAELHALLILETPPEERFDRITRITKALFNVPIAVISLIDRDRLWFKSSVGLPVNEIGRQDSCCSHAILQEDIFVLEDASIDPRFKDSALVLGPPNICFYAGAQLTMPSGHNMGTLCIIDHEPRKFSPQQQSLLADLSKIVVGELAGSAAQSV